jgi:hypothetical protein
MHHRPARRPRLLGRLGQLVALFALILIAMPAGATLVVGSDTLRGTAYTTYREPGQDGWRFSCQTPCPIPLATLQSAANGFIAAKAQLFDLAGIDPVPSLAPVDIFFESNSICPLYPGVSGYASTYQPYGSGSSLPLRAYACLFLWNRQQAGDIDYFTPEQAGLISSQTLIVHEYAHSLFFLRHRYSYEDFVRYWSYAISGAVPLPEGACSESLVTYMAPMIPALCRQYGAGAADFRYAMERLDDLYQSNLGYHGRATSVAQLRESFDLRFGADTRALFIGLGYRPQEVGTTYAPMPTGTTPPLYAYNLTMPDDTFSLFGFGSLPTPVKLEQPSCLPAAPFVDFSLAFDLVQPAHRENAPLADPVFAGALTMTYAIGDRTPPAGVRPERYRFYRATARCGQAGIGWQEHPAVIDLEAGYVIATIVQGGTYALMQPDVIARRGFD